MKLLASSQTSTAHSLASRDSATQTQDVTFRIDGQLLGVPVCHVQEVLNPQKVTPVPLAPPELAGLLNLRGQIVTAVSVRQRLDLPDSSRSRDSMNVVVQHRGESFSLLVDEVGDVIDAESDAVEPAPPTLSTRWRQMTDGVIQLADELLVVLDVDRLLSLNSKSGPAARGGTTRGEE